MKKFLGILCVTLAVQLVVVLGDAEQHVPGRFKAGLEFHQDAGDKAATRSITSSDAVERTDPVQTHLEEEDLNAEKVAEEAKDDGLEDLDTLGDNPLEDADQLVTRGLDEELDEFATEEGEDQEQLDTRGLLDSGMNIPSVDSVRQTASNLGRTASMIPGAVSSAIQNPQATRESLRSALNSAKDRVLGQEMRKQMADLYKSGLNKGIEAYKTLNQHISPGMAKTLNHGVSSAIRGVQAAKESQIAKSISEKVGSWLP